MHNVQMCNVWTNVQCANVHQREWLSLPTVWWPPAMLLLKSSSVASYHHQCHHRYHYFTVTVCLFRLEMKSDTCCYLVFFLWQSAERAGNSELFPKRKTKALCKKAHGRTSWYEYVQKNNLTDFGLFCLIHYFRNMFQIL